MRWIIKVPVWVQYATLLGFLVITVIIALFVLKAEQPRRTLFSDSLLVSTRFIPAGTPGESINLRPQRGVFLMSDRDDRLIYDAEYVRGRVAGVEIYPGRALRKADFKRR